MVANSINLRTTEGEKIDFEISLYAWGIKRLLDSINAYKVNMTKISKLPIGRMMRASIYKLCANLQKLEQIGTDLTNRIKHTRSMGSYDGRDSVIKQLETEVDIFYEMMKIQKQKYMNLFKHHNPCCR